MTPLSVKEIRERFPNPITCEASLTAPEGSYCVGGAFLLASGLPNSFAITAIAKQFENLLGMSRREAVRAAGSIAFANDSGDFETAWSKLDEALSYGKPK